MDSDKVWDLPVAHNSKKSESDDQQEENSGGKVEGNGEAYVTPKELVSNMDYPSMSEFGDLDNMEFDDFDMASDS
jgi:hypothetical protein